MNFDAFTARIQGSQSPLILLEGRRSIPETAARSARRVVALQAALNLSRVAHSSHSPHYALPSPKNARLTW